MLSHFLLNSILFLSFLYSLYFTPKSLSNQSTCECLVPCSNLITCVKTLETKRLLEVAFYLILESEHKFSLILLQYCSKHPITLWNEWIMKIRQIIENRQMKNNTFDLFSLHNFFWCKQGQIQLKNLYWNVLHRSQLTLKGANKYTKEDH